MFAIQSSIHVPYRPSMRKTCTLLLVSAFSSLFASAQFIVKDVLAAAPQASIFDPEYNMTLNLVCWKADDNSLWISGLNPVTRMFEPADGKGTYVTDSLSPFGGPSSNGPEWMLSTLGTQVVYNQTIGGIRYPGVATKVMGGWDNTTLYQYPDAIYSMATSNYADSSALFLYETLEQDGMHWVRNTDLNKSFCYPDKTMGFFARDNQQICCATDKSHHPGYIETAGTFPHYTSISNDTIGAPFMWIDPPTSSRMFMYRSNGYRTLKIFKESVSGQWELYNEFNSPVPVPYQYITSPEPFTSGGHSYISFMAAESSSGKDGLPALIYIAAVNPADSLMRLVSDSTLSVRTDPEPVVFPDSTFIFYTHVITLEGGIIRFNVRKCDTGLGNLYTSIKAQKEASSGISVFPNPTHGVLNIENSGSDHSTGLGRIEILDKQGKIVYKKAAATSSACRLNLAFLPSGSYTLLIHDARQNYSREILLVN